ncbi:LysR family transcriptional regulator [Ahrensia sp. R2A130]|uniref:LysR family transcriptional regulator n=1 Tax=Ahrensia sp. R2A130 TaxID=744979 RepID=UPI0001E0E0AA|nr:LysR family transcriptional regulator [Ahrensia sp. R2A130]EFL89334.1 LysR family transcriptional regulator [Ahrensia sp. R2A130]
MQTRVFQTLAHVARTGSFTTAAKASNMTLSALSMQMKGLETELGVDLFDRSVRPPKLTPLGQAVAKQAEAVLAQQRVLLDLCQSDDELVGHFRIGFISSAYVRVLPRLLALAAEHAPKARFEPRSGLTENLCELVEAGQLDGAVVSHMLGSTRQLQFDTLALEEMAAAVPVDLKDCSIAELTVACTFLQFTPETGVGRLIASIVSEWDRLPKHVIVLDSIEATMEAVRSGIGFALLPMPDIDRYLGTGIVVLELDQPVERTLAFASRPDVLNDRWRSKLNDLLKRCIGDSV